MHKLFINELVEQTLNQLHKIGLSQATVNFYKIESFEKVLQFYKRKGIFVYSPAIMNEYISFEQMRFTRGEIGKKHFRALELGANRLSTMAETGQLKWALRKRGSAIPVPQEYKTLLNDYLSALQQSESTINGKASIVRKYLSYLSQRGQHYVQKWCVQDLKQFIWDTLENYSSKSHLLSVLKNFHAYLSAQGMLAFEYDDAFFVPAASHKKVLPCFSQEELIQILSAINLNEPNGRRDYAILLLAITTGLRTIDIAFLRLEDIDWESGKLSLLQQKTGYPLTLPINASVLSAIADYVLNERPVTPSKYVFLRANAPHQGFKDGHAIAHIFRRRLKSAGLKKENGDGRSVHALRRTLGTRMVELDVPASTITQILGHKSSNSIKRYLSLEHVHLKKCALSLSGIETNRKELMKNV